MRKRRPDPSFVASAGLGSRRRVMVAVAFWGIACRPHSRKQCPKRVAKLTRRGFVEPSCLTADLSSGFWRQEVARAGKSLHKVPSAHVQLTRTGAPLPGSTRAKQKNRKKKKGKRNRFGGWGTEVLARVPDGRVHGVGSECINQIGSLSQPRTTSNNVFVQLVQWFISLWLGYAGDGAARPGPQLHANENRWTRSHIH